MAKCPYCGKELDPGERYCFHCEQDVTKVADEEEKPKLDEQKKK